MRKLVIIIVLIALVYVFRVPLMETYHNYISPIISPTVTTGVIEDKNYSPHGVASFDYYIMLNGERYSIRKDIWDTLNQGDTITLHHRFKDVEQVVK